jgi:cytochrome c oxidase subunit III
VPLLDEHERRAVEHTVLVRHRLEEQYENLEQQNQTSALGMWLFLATEVMFFGTLFTVLSVYRYLYTDAFEHASRRLNWQIASINTVVLLVSSMSMALAVYFVQAGRTRALIICLLTTAALGIAFLGFKGYEYYDDYQQGLILGSQFSPSDWIEQEGLSPDQIPQVQLFLFLYWFMTAGHALHVIIGIGAVLTMAVLAAKGRFDAAYYGPVDVTGLYWHFVDVVWIFLLPMLYLLGTH